MAGGLRLTSILQRAKEACYSLSLDRKSQKTLKCEVQVLPSFVGRVRCLISTMPFEAQKAVIVPFEKLNNRYSPWLGEGILFRAVGVLLVFEPVCLFVERDQSLHTDTHKQRMMMLLVETTNCGCSKGWSPVDEKQRTWINERDGGLSVRVGTKMGETRVLSFFFLLNGKRKNKARVLIWVLSNCLWYHINILGSSRERGRENTQRLHLY